MEDGHKQIIIKKVKKKQSGGAHGGSWKVAYADFVTAMMAFFLLLWLLSMVSDEKRIALSEYFSQYSIFQQSGTSAVASKGAKKMDPHLVVDLEDSPKEMRSMSSLGKGCDSFIKRSKRTVTANDEEIVKKIRSSVDDKMAGIRDQILVDVIEGGIRIQIIDTEGSMMFPSGSAQPTAKAMDVLRLVAENINDIPGRIVVEGHTDASPYKEGQLTNWELSTSRASAARLALERFGTDPKRIARVVGYADQELLLPLDPLDQRNRRISVIILQSQE